MKCVLCISAPGRVADSCGRIRAGHRRPVQEASTPEQAWEALETGAFDYILVNSPFAGGDGCRLAVEAAERQPKPRCCCSCGRNGSKRPPRRSKNRGVFVITKPINKSGFFDALRLVAAARKRLFGLTDENLRLRARIEELRLIDRAKCTLISVLNISGKGGAPHDRKAGDGPPADEKAGGGAHPAHLRQRNKEGVSAGKRLLFIIPICDTAFFV